MGRRMRTRVVCVLAGAALFGGSLAFLGEEFATARPGVMGARDDALVNPCKLLTLEELSSVVGESFDEPGELDQEEVLEGFPLNSCWWQSSGELDAHVTLFLDTENPFGNTWGKRGFPKTAAERTAACVKHDAFEGEVNGVPLDGVGSFACFYPFPNGGSDDSGLIAALVDAKRKKKPKRGWSVDLSLGSLLGDSEVAGAQEKLVSLARSALAELANTSKSSKSKG